MDYGPATFMYQGTRSKVFFLVLCGARVRGGDIHIWPVKPFEDCTCD